MWTITVVKKQKLKDEDGLDVIEQFMRTYYKKTHDSCLKKIMSRSDIVRVPIKIKSNDLTDYIKSYFD